MMTVSWGQGSVEARSRQFFFTPLWMRSLDLGQANDEPLFLSLLQELIVELPPVSSPVDRIYPFIADVGTDRFDHLEELVVLAFEVF